MTKRRTAKPGDILQIPLGDGTFGYCKVLAEPETAFFNHRTFGDDFELEKVLASGVIFRNVVMLYAFKPKSSWRIIGYEDLTEDEMIGNRYFKRDIITGKLSVYHESKNYPQKYKEWPATYEECVGLECAAVWDPVHIESRLLDHFEGRENKWVKSLALKP